MKRKLWIIVFVLLLCISNASAGFLTGAYGKKLLSKLMSDGITEGISLEYFDVNHYSPSSSKAVATFEEGSVDIDLITAKGTKAIKFSFFNTDGCKIDSSKGPSEFTFYRDLCGYAKTDECKMGLGTLRDVWVFRSDSNEDFQISIFNNTLILLQYWSNEELTLLAWISYTPENWDSIETLLNKLVKD